MRLAHGRTLPKVAAASTATRRKRSTSIEGILKHQNALTAILHKLKRPQRPPAIELLIHGIFVSQTFNDGPRRLFGGCAHNPQVAASSFRAVAAPSAENDPTIFPSQGRKIHSNQLTWGLRAVLPV